MFVSLYDIFFLFTLAMKKEELVMRLHIAQLGSSSQKIKSFIEILCNSKAFHVEDTHPVDANKTSLLSTHGVVLSCFLFVSLVFRLSMGKFGKSVASTSAIRFFFNYFFERLKNFLEVWVLVKANVIVCFVFDRVNEAIGDSSLNPVETFLLVGLDTLWVISFNHEFSEDEASEISLGWLTLDNSF